MSDPNSNITEAPSPGGGAATAVVKPPPPKPAAPVAKPPAKKGADRRFFLFTWIGLAWTLLAGSSAVLTLGTVRFLFPNVLSEPPSKVKVGFPDQFDEGKVDERFKDKNIWVVKYQSKLIALSTTCTHLGCTPNYLEKEGKFKCPCHGSGFYGPAMGDPGINFEGPAPRPLERWALGIGDDGQVVVDKSRKFQQERGEWTNVDSYIKV
jgi:cytochrome b6-f complex iron-sulfur subunit